MNRQSRFAAMRSLFLCLQATLLAPLLTLALSGAANARGQFGPPFIVSGALHGCVFPRVAIDADGDAIFTWTTTRDAGDGFADVRIRARTRSKTGVFGPILTLSSRSVVNLDGARPAMDAAGNALVVWTLFPKGAPNQDSRPPHAQFRVLSSAGVLGPIKEMSSIVPADSARVAMSRNGRAVFFWRRLNNNQTLAVMETRTRSAAGVLGPIKSVSLFQELSSAASELAMNARGDAVFTWQRRIGGVNPHTVVQVRRRAAAGNLGALHQNLGAGFFNKVAINGQGNAIIAWTENVSGSTRVEMRTLSATDVLGPRQFISEGSGNAQMGEVAMNAAGDAVFGYTQMRGSLLAAKARARSAAGGLTGPQTLSPSGFAAFSPGAAIDSHARSVFVWAGGPLGTPKAQARTRSATGTLGQVKTLDDARPGNSATVAMNPRGDAAAVWCEVDLSGNDAVFTVHGAVTPVP